MIKAVALFFVAEPKHLFFDYQAASKPNTGCRAVLHIMRGMWGVQCMLLERLNSRREVSKLLKIPVGENEAAVYLAV